MLFAICAMGLDRSIGYKNKLIWRIPEDLSFFKRITYGKTVLMGRKTFESIGKPLPGRKNWVLSRKPGFFVDSVQFFCSLDEVLKNLGDEDVFLIGGEQIYKQFLPFCDGLYLTIIESPSNEADVFFPANFEDFFSEKKVLFNGNFNNIEYKIFELNKKTN